MKKGERSLEDLAFIKDLVNFIVTILDKHEKCGSLDSHGDTIPEDEIWLKKLVKREKTILKWQCTYAMFQS